MLFLLFQSIFHNNLKVLSYWNLNNCKKEQTFKWGNLKVLSYWNLNFSVNKTIYPNGFTLKYYHIGI